MAAQLVGAIGLTCTAPAAYYIGTGRLSERAFILWAANWIFVGTRFISFNCGSILPERLLSLRNLLKGSSSYWRSRHFSRPWLWHRSGACSLPW
ncbi:MAG: hypothetical protein WCA27_11755 [Candidatus Sulfotelmatobacter sp.]